MDVSRAEVEECEAPPRGGVTPLANGQQFAISNENHGAIRRTLSRRTPELPKATSTSQPHPVSRRVDALVLAFRVQLRTDVARTLEVAAGSAETHGRAAVVLGSLAFELRNSRKSEFFHLENADCRVVVDLRAAEGWTVEVVLRAIFLATHVVRDALSLAEQIATELGAWTGKRVRRVDLCADFVGFPLRWSDAKRFVTQRAGLTSFVPETKDFDRLGALAADELVRVYADRGRVVTGFTIGKGNALSARIYDKTIELRVTGDEGKRHVEESQWGREGWLGESVTRVEFQARGMALDELDLRDPDNLEERLDALWQYCVSWLRLIEPGSASRLRRCKNDRRWEAVTSLIFFHESAPARRQRVRGGARAEHVLGAARSRLASLGILTSMPLQVTADGEIVGHEEFVNRLSEQDAAEAAAAYTRTLFEKAAREVTSTLLTQLGPRALLARLYVRNDASCARFGSDDDPPNGTQR